MSRADTFCTKCCISDFGNISDFLDIKNEQDSFKNNMSGSCLNVLFKLACRGVNGGG